MPDLFSFECLDVRGVDTGVLRQPQALLSVVKEGKLVPTAASDIKHGDTVLVVPRDNCPPHPVPSRVSVIAVNERGIWRTLQQPDLQFVLEFEDKTSSRLFVARHASVYTFVANESRSTRADLVKQQDIVWHPGCQRYGVVKDVLHA